MPDCICAPRMICAPLDLTMRRMTARRRKNDKTPEIYERFFRIKVVLQSDFCKKDDILSEINGKMHGMKFITTPPINAKNMFNRKKFMSNLVIC